MSEEVKGIGHKSMEGDGITSVGEFCIRMGFYRPDKVKRSSSSHSFNNHDETNYQNHHNNFNSSGLDANTVNNISSNDFNESSQINIHEHNINNGNNSRFESEELYHDENSSLISKITGIPIIEMKQEYGWCDDMFDEMHYNRLVRLPIPSSHEKLWRDDDLYDIVLVLGYNDNPVILGKGSAIFMHITNGGPTSGCIALSREDLFEILTQITPYTTIHISL
ncbi:hypothetical protein FDP41_001814 [Naegleria fowleri]|uniref:L,D-TPase catalytic domain-containing protein n=1 Tax=Naegleria fowleri TaxID=5763 RepID=A0A6A5BY64_NAEFO|nr:uncharacterized protein FDP41_001814 [Naegleria fowleri]KAF0979471.1 hypothetical protein FDP41_001814 [Naegleria fowleri]